jgi:hypothetical protein
VCHDAQPLSHAPGARVAPACHSKPSEEALQSCDTLLIVASSFPYIEHYPKPGSGRAVQIDEDSWHEPAHKAGRACPLRPGTSDVNLLRYRERVFIDLNAQISDDHSISSAPSHPTIGD